MWQTWLTYCLLFTQVLLASTEEFLASQVLDGEGSHGSSVKTLVKRSPAAGANKRVRRGILEAAMKAKDLTTAAIRGVITMKNKIRELKGDEEDDEPFRPIDVDAILRREGSTYEDGSTEENGDTVPAPMGYEAGLYPPNYPYVDAHGNGIPRPEFRKGW